MVNALIVFTVGRGVLTAYVLLHHSSRRALLRDR